ncbi:4-diphosphocytidyl-2-C-methyl-D-erythritol kinase [Sulfitobacter noctilucicola]|uniref:4-diphosphocytidyl-2-C-methyl-D-erythritol kinase n=1 Tax=Sulfitobacter noctilucicola TaxID=1342301 RepID=A0A7W6Q3S4_9RHOB|nr:4-(cytidine 5'-diphospho)-2-C-methyl-D-erythritol kinase [Sulfitobacter noctilucicola]KIN62087.1 4-diphosphocytidyl-2-C-methyl-D-erythritol kinase [Sulfitobacter noctilucicola]MBB4173394.1 4-diphosphocytidyl-2-C-methyl-D-erythritol kinase [Sulfitobacter noctilucicola]
MTSEGFAPAKINLALHLTGLRDDGYHLLDSLVVFADVGDQINAEAADGLSLTVSGPFAEGVPVDDSNLVLKAARHLRSLRGVTDGAALHLEKKLPHGGGIGGGSSDAAATIRVLARLWGVAPLTAQEALVLGADVPVCLAAPQPMFMRGIGDVLEPAEGIPEGWLVLVNPRVPVPTQAVFKLHDKLYPVANPGLEDFRFDKDIGKFEAWLLGQRNDLTKVACEEQIAPVVSDVLEALQKLTSVREMSGSGSTCWGWFRSQDASEIAAEQLAQSHPDWWVKAARISGSS